MFWSIFTHLRETSLKKLFRVTMLVKKDTNNISNEYDPPRVCMANPT